MARFEYKGDWVNLERLGEYLNGWGEQQWRLVRMSDPEWNRKVDDWMVFVIMERLRI